MIEDIKLFLSREDWIEWFVQEHFWVWLAGYIIILGLLSRAICSLWLISDGEREALWIIALIAVFGSVMAVMWHGLLVVLLMLIVAGLVLGGIPAGLGYLCYRFKKKRQPVEPPPDPW